MEAATGRGMEAAAGRGMEAAGPETTACRGEYKEARSGLENGTVRCVDMEVEGACGMDAKAGAAEDATV